MLILFQYARNSEFRNWLIFFPLSKIFYMPLFLLSKICPSLEAKFFTRPSLHIRWLPQLCFWHNFKKYCAGYLISQNFHKKIEVNHNFINSFLKNVFYLYYKLKEPYISEIFIFTVHFYWIQLWHNFLKIQTQFWRIVHVFSFFETFFE